MPCPDTDSAIPTHGPALVAYAAARFQAWSGAAPTLAVRAPGRVNLIGEHTDYNGGPVLPMAIEREVVIVARPIPERKLRLFAAQFDAVAEIDLGQPVPPEDRSWLSYAVGAVSLAPAEMREQGAEALILGTVPLGSGLSSSAALEMALLALLESLSGVRLDDGEAARLGQAIEHQFLGLHCGIMDQYVSRAARSGHALFLHCDSLEHRHIPVNFPDHAFVILDSQSSRRLETSVYNDRVAETAAALRMLNDHYGRDARELVVFSRAEFEALRPKMSPLVARRARHFFVETERTHGAVHALEAGKARDFGGLMTASHESLREDYEVSSPALEALVSAALAGPGCLGARLTGAGFGGCTINLVERGEIAAFIAFVQARYQAITGTHCLGMATLPSAGAGGASLGPD